MAEKFKVGDRVRYIKRWSDVDDSAGLIVGETYVVVGIHGSDDERLYIEAPNSREHIMRNEQLELVKRGNGKISKPKPYKFALQYELSSDPTEYFHDMKEVKKRVKELASNPNLKKDQVFVHEIKNTKQITITSIIGIKFVTVK